MTNEEALKTYKNEEWLLLHCKTMRITDQDIAKNINVNPKTISLWRNKYGILPGKSYLPTKEEITSMECNCEHDDELLIKKLQITKNMLKRARERYLVLPKYLEEKISKNELRDLYYNKKLSYNKISKMKDIDMWVLAHIGRIYGIKLRTASESIHLARGNSVSLSGYARNFIYGEVMGDGSLTQISPFSANYTHTSKYREYAVWLSNKLESFGISPVGGIVQYNIRGVTTYHYASRAYPELLEMRKLWYPQGKKLIPGSLSLSPVLLRQYFIGDGGLSGRKTGRRGINLYTCGFDISNIDFLRGLLRDIGIDTSYQQSSNIIHISPRGAIRFLDYIGPCPKEIENVYGYKWRAKKREELDWQEMMLKK